MHLMLMLTLTSRSDRARRDRDGGKRACCKGTLVLARTTVGQEAVRPYRYATGAAGGVGRSAEPPRTKLLTPWHGVSSEEGALLTLHGNYLHHNSVPKRDPDCLHWQWPRDRVY